MAWRDVSPEELPDLLALPGLVVVDQRDEAARSRGQLPGAQGANERLLRELIGRRGKAPPILVYCYHGNQSRELCDFLAQFGLPTVFNLAGGWQALENVGLRVPCD